MFWQSQSEQNSRTHRLLPAATSQMPQLRLAICPIAMSQTHPQKWHLRARAEEVSLMKRTYLVVAQFLMSPSGILSFTFRSSLSAVADVDLLPGPKGPQGRQKLKSGPLQAGQTGQIKKLWRYSSHLWRFDPLQDSSHKGTDHDLGIGARLHFSA
mmetsp:Transcript_13636/g.19172  ORF Transcript_13636/g.19172 Transcript_13636/m.19172 type:complete len:155 (-) Transcript_13636:282-746(-)